MFGKLLCFLEYHNLKEIKRKDCENVGFCKRCGVITKIINRLPMKYTTPAVSLTVGVDKFRSIKEAFDAAEPYQNIYVERGKW